MIQQQVYRHASDEDDAVVQAAVTSDALERCDEIGDDLDTILEEIDRVLDLQLQFQGLPLVYVQKDGQ